MLVDSSQVDEGCGLELGVVAQRGLALQDVAQLARSTVASECVREGLEDQRIGRVLLLCPDQVGQGFFLFPGVGVEVRGLEQRARRERSFGELDHPIERDAQRLRVARPSLEFHDGAMNGRVVGRKLVSAPKPDAGCLRGLESFELEVARLERDRSAPACAKCEVEASLEEICEQLPLLAGGSIDDQCFDGLLTARIVGERPTKSLGRAFGLAQGAAEHVAQCDERWGAVGPAYETCEALPRASSVLEAAQRLERLRQTPQCVLMLGVDLQCSFEARARLGLENFEFPAWRIDRSGDTLIMLRAVTLSAEATERTIFPDCGKLGEIVRARADQFADE